MVIVIEEFGSQSGERRGHGPAMFRITRPQEVEIPSELRGPVHDAGDLTHHDGRGVLLSKGPQDGQRIESDGVVAGDRPLVSEIVVVAQARGSTSASQIV